MASSQPAVIHAIPCQVCGQGTLIKKQVYRMSSPVVAIGYLFLAPCILGLVFSGLMFIAAITLGRGGSAFGMGFALLTALASFVGGLFGWLLVMKKTVLRCEVCSATIQAS